MEIMIMMKYYELKLDDTNFIEAPNLINWYGIQDVRLIKWIHIIN